MTNVLNILKRVPWWGYLIAVVGILFLFGETKVSVDSVSVAGQDLGGVEYDSAQEDDD